MGTEMKLEGNVTLTPYICDTPILFHPPPE
jgi:hypothetical protein